MNDDCDRNDPEIVSEEIQRNNEDTDHGFKAYWEGLPRIEGVVCLGSLVIEDTPINAKSAKLLWLASQQYAIAKSIDIVRKVNA